MRAEAREWARRSLQETPPAPLDPEQERTLEIWKGIKQPPRQRRKSA